MTARTDWRTHRPLMLPALALWGWQSGLLWPALAMAAVLEAPRLVSARLDITQKDFERLWNFTSVLFLAVVMYLVVSRLGFDSLSEIAGSAPAVEQRPEGMRLISTTALTFLRWLPYVMFPFLAALVWSRTTALTWTTFSLYEQARARRHPDAPPPSWAKQPVHPGYIYIGVVLFASTTNPGDARWYLPALVVALGISLWPWRNRSHGPLMWLVLAVVVAAACLAAPFSHQATRAAWAAVEERLQGVAGAGQGGGSANPDQLRRTTALGAIGQLKQSSTIILRITSGEDPGLLREAAFARFRGRQWDCGELAFQPLADLPIPAGGATITVEREAIKAIAPLALPAGTVAIGHLPPSSLETGGLGALRLRDSLPIATYEAIRLAQGQRVGDPPPQPEDSALDKLAADDAANLKAITAELGLERQTPADAAITLERWFGAHFSYALWQDQRPNDASPLSHFLTTSRAGHCEFFATATVLLLRQAGIPTRYAVGYSPEAEGDGRWLARGRDAHAWCLAWIDGGWRDVDLTPATWRGDEAATRPWYEGIHDAWSNGWHAFAVWKQSGSGWRLAVLTVGMLVLAWIAWRQIRGSAWRKARTGDERAQLLGLDSEFLALMGRIGREHGERLAHETPASWLARLGLGQHRDLGEALALHQRLRFDPAGLDDATRARLLELCRMRAVPARSFSTP